MILGGQPSQSVSAILIVPTATTSHGFPPFTRSSYVHHLSLVIPNLSHLRRATGEASRRMCSRRRPRRRRPRCGAGRARALDG